MNGGGRRFVAFGFFFGFVGTGLRLGRLLDGRRLSSWLLIDRGQVGVWSSGRAGPEYKTHCKNNGQDDSGGHWSSCSSQSPTVREGVSDETRCDVPAGIPGFRPASVSNENPHPVNP